MAVHKKHICFITPGHIASNPRLVKEAEAVFAAGYQVSIIMSQYLNYLIELDLQIIEKNNKWKVYIVKWTGNNLAEKFLRNFTAVRSWILRSVYKNSGLGKLADTIISRISFEQVKVARIVKADLYIAHNLGALPIAAKAAAYHKKNYAFDAEDYHRGQVKKSDTLEFCLIKTIEDQYIPNVAYVSAASPLIGKKYQEHYPNQYPIIINNVFSKVHQMPIPSIHPNQRSLKLFWFSQTVGNDRGIEDVIKAMANLIDRNISLTLLGKCSNPQKESFLQSAVSFGLPVERIKFIDSTAPEKIFDISRKHDIGLALEVPHVLNRDLCLTNKIFTYLIAGNAIIASETAAQRQFMENYPDIGKSYPIGDIEKLTEILSFFYIQREELKKCRQASWHLANTELNWENESKKFISKIEDLLAKK